MVTFHQVGHTQSEQQDREHRQRHKERHAKSAEDTTAQGLK